MVKLNESVVRAQFDTEEMRDCMQDIQQRMIDLDRAVKNFNEVAPVDLKIKIEVDKEW